mgnify:CR=1 FL=1
MARPGQLLIPAVSLAFAATAVYRFGLLGGHLGGFENDEYLVISRAAAMLRGELPSRDFVDPGYPLAYAASALSLGAAGGTLLGHALLTVGMLALGAALTAAIAMRASGSLLVALTAAFIQLGLGPRLYNYPKIVLYAAAILAWWSYVDRPSSLKLAGLGVLTAIAFLLRHDHGAYIGLGTMVMLGALATGAGAGTTAGRAAAYLIACAVCVAPYLVFLQTRGGGVFAHLRVGAEFSRVDRDRTQLRRPPFDIDWRAPLVTVDAPAPPPRRPGLWDDVQRAVPALRARLAPGILRRANAVPFIYYLWLAIPPIAAATLAAGVLRRRDAPAWADVARYGPVVVIGLLLNVWFLRGTLPVRLADVSVLTAALGAWLIGRSLPRERWRSPVLRGACIAGLGVALAATAVSAAAVGYVDVNLRQMTEDDGVRGLRRRLARVARELATPGPVLAKQGARESGILQVADYLHVCLGPTDRALVTGYRPEVFYFAGRGFAAGHVDVRAGYLSRPADQEQAVARMRAQSVPLVITEPAAEFEERYRPESPILLAYLDESYASAGDHDFSGAGFQVLVRRDRRPVRMHPSLALPCFR